MPSQPFLSDSEQVLLYKIADAVVSGGGGGGGAGVSSFNTRTGAVTLELADISSLADARYVLKGGDTMTGGLIAPSLTASTLVATPLLSVTANANASAVTAAGYSVTGAGATNMVDLAGTWNTSGNPTALKLNITNTASGATAKLFDLQVGGVSQFNVSKAGAGTFVGLLTAPRLTLTNTTADQPIISSSGYSITGAGSQDMITMSGTWDTFGSPVLLKLNVTNTNSSANARLIELQTGGTLRFAISKTGSPGFFSTVPPASQGVSGANLTNNVTNGGTDNIIANYTDLTTYATDAAAIRNNIYQLARKLKQVNDALRTYGLLT